MSKRKVYDVSPRGEGWAVKQRGARRAVGLFEDKSDAVSRARGIAKQREPAQVVVRTKDGSIQTEYTYGGDPSPPRG
ncbi:MAG TPA: DUF2188 domain-containing protein [Myxococcaceae bacterium]|nr:DUF2188 domain-containing protein [Myxococcaceae bacterium]